MLIGLDSVADLDDKRADYIAEWVFAGHCHVAFLEDEATGYGVLHYHFYHSGFVEMLMVGTRFRRQGVARALVRHFAGQCRTPKLWTSTNRSNTAMQILLEKEGFVQSGVIDNLDDDDQELVYFKDTRG